MTPLTLCSPAVMNPLTLSSQVMMTLVLTLLHNLTPVSSYSMGAPDSSCSAMTPGHQPNSPQDLTVSRPPANISLEREVVRPGEMLGLELVGDRFKGFVIQARDVKDKNSQVGSFVLTGDDASYLTCGRGIHNSITHRKSSPKTSVKAQWRAPSNFEGEVVFRFTCLKDYNTFWVGLETKSVRVTRNTNEPVAEITENKVTDNKVTDDTVKDVEKVMDEEDETKVETTKPDLEPSVKSDSGVNSIEEKVEQVKEKKESSRDSDFEFALLDREEKQEDAVQAEQEEKVVQPKTSTEEKVEAESYTPRYISSTTTLKTTTTTTPRPKEPLRIVNGILQHTDPEDPIYDGCNTTKACFGMPAGCEESGKCQLVVAYQPEKEEYRFEMKGLSNGYISMGLSKDNTMGDDLTTNCVRQSNGQIDINTGFNVGFTGNKRVPRGPRKENTDGVSDRSQFSIKDGWISCSWKRKGRAVVEDHVWDLEKDLYHVMLAQGTARDGTLEKHRARIISGHKRGLGEVGLVKARSRLYIILHGSFMIAAWVCSASLGIMIARYYKQTWTASRCCSQDQWFVLHRFLMMLTWGLTIAGFVLILLELKGLSNTFNTNPHALLGFVTVGLCFIQPFIALVRCSPNHPNRGWFNWSHWLIGNSAQIVGVVCIFYAVDLTAAQLPRPETDWLLVGFVGFHFLAHLLMSCVACVTESQNTKSGYPLAMRPLTRPNHHLAYPDYEELKRDAPGSGVRIFVLIVYMMINIIVTAALILLVVMAPTRPKLEEFGILPPAVQLSS